MSALLWAADIIATTGCRDRYADLAPGRDGSPANEWMSRGGPTTNPTVRWFLNFYETEESYDDYGLIIYNGGPDSTAYSEHELLVDSLRLCRVHFQQAYANEAMTTWDVSRNEHVAFKPTHISIVIDWEEPQNEDVVGNQTGAVFVAEEVFDSDANLNELVSSVDIKRGKLRYAKDDRDGSFRIVNSMVEDHMAAQN